MKRILAVALLFLTLSLSACQSSNELSIAFDKMDDLESYRIDMIMKIPSYGTINLGYEIDGDVYMIDNPLEGTTYFKTVKGKDYQYTYFRGEYVLSDEPVEDASEDFVNLDEFNIRDFEVDEQGRWVSNGEKIYLNDEKTQYIENIIITITEDGYVDKMYMDMYVESLTVEVTMEFSKLNAVEIIIE